jgi:hypothetical protein
MRHIAQDLHTVADFGTSRVVPALASAPGSLDSFPLVPADSWEQMKRIAHTRCNLELVHGVDMNQDIQVSGLVAKMIAE